MPIVLAGASLSVVCQSVGCLFGIQALSVDRWIFASDCWSRPHSVHLTVLNKGGDFLEHVQSRPWLIRMYGKHERVSNWRHLVEFPNLLLELCFLQGHHHPLFRAQGAHDWRHAAWLLANACLTVGQRQVNYYSDEHHNNCTVITKYAKIVLLSLDTMKNTHAYTTIKTISAWHSLSRPGRPLFLASTVSTLHRNAHIWNASHPLLVTYDCWVTVYSPSMEAKKKSRKYIVDSGTRTCCTCEYWYAVANCAISSIVPQWVVPFSRQMPINLNFKPQLVLRI